ncbi:FAD-dependent oxidoreductase [Cohnella endophytica]|uniref:FAD-dependent oxidoreductase n=1 Tax=Cohnella endophytica TaxID=2419778 RepID=A0A494XJ53_9BACL|nr:FAD-dependent oxidoreductase [Cohnella endophytica]RKP49792.1 FAD-dependent oxidoreductase [Cohnella endophytica]
MFRRIRKTILCLCLIPIFLSMTFSYRITESLYRTIPEKLVLPVETGITQASYDVIVAGTDPEGIMAAISAARNGLKVLLVDGRNRTILGGLMTLGWLNSLDLNKAPVNYRLWDKAVFLDKGLFQEWYEGIRGTSFDVNHAANLFHRMVAAEPNIDLVMNTREMAPIMEGHNAVGMRIVKADGTEERVNSKAIIDATQDADIAAAAGAEYTMGREDLGDPNSEMAVTLVFKLSGVTSEVWDELKHHKNTGYDDRSIWGYQEAREYVSSKPKRVKIRSLNIGRQDGDTILINTMQIYGIHPLEPASVQEGLRIGEEEAPLIVDYLKKNFKEFSSLEFAGTAPELYVRETRHIRGEYRLTMADLMQNRDQWDAIAYGSYQVDIQSPNSSNTGAILMSPKQYGVPFRCLVPLKVDGLLVVGRSASFDTLPHGSARVIPLGMATGQAAGAAVKLALERGVSLRDMSRSKDDISELRKRLMQQGMDLRMRHFATPEYAKHKDYPGLLAAVSLGLTIGGYDNKGWALDEASDPKRFAYQLRVVQKKYPEFLSRELEPAALAAESVKRPLTLKQAASMLAMVANAQVVGKNAEEALLAKGWLKQDTLNLISRKDKLTNGDTFMLIRDVLQYGLGVTFI